MPVRGQRSKVSCQRSCNETSTVPYKPFSIRIIKTRFKQGTLTLTLLEITIYYNTFWHIDIYINFSIDTDANLNWFFWTLVI